MIKTINTEKFSQSLRQRSIDLDQQKLLMTNYHGTEQEQDLTAPANCDGFGRVRHFRRDTSDGWPSNPLPIDPASKALGIPAADLLQAQVFQNAACNWRCWYCYVPFHLLSADEKYSSWLSAADLMDLYLKEPARPKVIDLSGGQPDLVPEWVPWMMRELRLRRLDDDIYLWSDDNLSNDYFWRFLSDEDRELVATYRRYGKVCCFKGFNADSFAFNTCAAPDLFQQQFDLMRGYVRMGIDVYCYVTLTTPLNERIRDDMKRFVDSLQDISANLPLRMIPLEIREFAPVKSRLNNDHRAAMQNQRVAVAAWQDELQSRFTTSDLTCNIADVTLR
ncbi:MAG: radical SAM protein [Planctomycetes bacterium]|nr:radical SAM protein [Planctomycetota bacterium]